MPRRSYVVHTKREIDGIRQAGRLARRVLDEIGECVRPGMTTLELDEQAGRLIEAHGATSAFLGYRRFPGQICISVNDEVVHGIGRADRVMQVGDIVSIDCGVKYQGFIGDNAKTVCLGPESGEIANLLKVTRDSLMAGIAAARGGDTVYEISTAIDQVITGAGYSAVRDFVGHGVGVELHEPPEVPNYPNRRAREKLRPGMVLAIEPMVNVGTHRFKIDPDNWTVRTADGSLSAHFEHMVLITENEPEILTWDATAFA